MIMKVVFGSEMKDMLGDKFTFLELDTFIEEDKEPVTAYAVIGSSDVTIDEIPIMENHAKLHNDMLKEYKKRNWSYCHQALEHLKGKWRNSLDSFYEVFESRINGLEKQNLPSDWDGTVTK